MIKKKNGERNLQRWLRDAPPCLVEASIAFSHFPPAWMIVLHFLLLHSRGIARSRWAENNPIFLLVCFLLDRMAEKQSNRRH
jgi:hypothetical protein